MKNILITGGAGFVGSSLALGLLERRRNLKITILDNLKRRGSELILPRLCASGIRFIHGDIRNREDFETIGDTELIIECSAEPSVLAGYNNSPNYLINTNLVGLINTLEYARLRNAAIIFLSSSRVYPINKINSLRTNELKDRFVLTDEQIIAGASSQGISESFPLEGNRSLYGATKLCGELIINEYLEMYSLKGIINRCGVISGPWQMGKIDQGFVALWVAKHMYGGVLAYIGFGGKGKQVRDILHVEDLGEIVNFEIENIEKLSGETFNVGGGLKNSISLCELTSLCREITSNSLEIESIPITRPADIKIYISDNTRVSTVTGWRPRKTINNIICDIYNWIKKNSDELAPIIGK